MASTKHWGHVEHSSFESQAAHLIEITEAKPVVFEVPRLHQPSASHHAPSDELPLQCLATVKAPLDRYSQNTVLHSIELQHHKRRMRLMLMAAQHQQAADSTMKLDNQESLTLPAMPPPPRKFASPTGLIAPPGSMTILARAQATSYSERHCKATINVPELDSISNRQLLLRAVAAVCAHAGFEVANESALESLTDIADDFLNRFCKLLRFSVDNEALNGRTGFPDALEYALHETGLVGTMALCKYWQNGIQDYALRLQQEDRQLISDYQQISDPTSRTAMKTEPETTGALGDLSWHNRVKQEDQSDLKSSSHLCSSITSNKDTVDQSSAFPTTPSPFTVTGADVCAGPNMETNGDPNSLHWSLKTENNNHEDYDDPLIVVPATPHQS